MADPSPYTVSYGFSGFQANNPTSPLPAPALDNELANVATAVTTLVKAIEDVRRSDGALQNNIVTFDSLSSGLQLTFDPTNGTLVAAAVAGAQAAQVAASGSATAAAGSAAAATTQAANAATSAATVNLSLYFAKANNLAGVGNPDTARGNLNAAKVDGSDMTGRLSPVTGSLVTDWNTVVTSGWSSGLNAFNQPPGGPTAWLVETIAQNASTIVVQIAYNYAAASGGTDAVLQYRRFSYDGGSGNRLWTAWTSFGQVPVGSLSWLTGTAAPAGYVKANGTLLARATYPALYAFAAASGNIVSEAAWGGAFEGSYTTGDLTTTFRVPDLRGEFVRSFDDGRGIDAGRVIGSNQADSLKDHTHLYNQGSAPGGGALAAGAGATFTNTPTATGSPSTGAAAETRPKNVALLACIKF